MSTEFFFVYKISTHCIVYGHDIACTALHARLRAGIQILHAIIIGCKLDKHLDPAESIFLIAENIACGTLCTCYFLFIFFQIMCCLGDT